MYSVQRSNFVLNLGVAHPAIYTHPMVATFPHVICPGLFNKTVFSLIAVEDILARPLFALLLLPETNHMQ